MKNMISFIIVNILIVIFLIAAIHIKIFFLPLTLFVFINIYLIYKRSSDLDKNEQPINWKVENSWGDEVGKKGIFSMSDAWFTEYNYEAIVNKKYLPEEAIKGLNEDAIELEPFDPIC